jgi:hypothetical protein
MPALEYACVGGLLVVFLNYGILDTRFIDKPVEPVRVRPIVHLRHPPCSRTRGDVCDTHIFVEHAIDVNP